jgi:hypothetical protein
MRIGNQWAGRDVHNYEMTAERMDVETRRRLEEIENALRDAVASGALEDEDADEVTAAAQEVAAAAKDPIQRRSRLLTALEVVKNLSAAAASTAGVADAADKIIRTVTGP